MRCHSPVKQTGKAELQIKSIKFKKTAPRLEMTDTLRQVSIGNRMGPSKIKD